MEEKIASEEELNGEDKKANEIVEDAVHFAESSPEPAAEELFKNIYVEEGR